MSIRLLMCAAMMAHSPLLAQATPEATPPASSPIAAPSTQRAVMQAGTELPVRLLEELTTKNKQLRVGQRIRLETAEPVIVQGVVVVPTGSRVAGEITSVTNKGMWGKSGHFAGRVLYVDVNGRQIRLTGPFDDKGVAGGIGAVAVSAIVFLPAGFFMTGTSAYLPVGTVIKAFVDENVPLELNVQPVAPLSVGAAPVSLTPPPSASPVANATTPG